MINAFFLILARIFLSLIFLINGVDHLVHWNETEKTLITTLSEWHAHIGSFQTFHTLFTFLLSWSSTLLSLGIVLELGGALMILTGFKDRLGAFFLILFLAPYSLFFYNFWSLENVAHELQEALFLKNLAILGGLIFVATHGVHKKPKAGKDSYLGLS